MTDPNSFFKSYDIRGTCPDLNADIYYWSGYALISEIMTPQNLPKKINVMHDIRYSSSEFYLALIQGILDAGGEIVPLGLGSTDLLYAACQLSNLPGAMITASHNPKDDNGLKIVKKHPQMLGLGSGLEKIRDFAVAKIKNDTVWQKNITEIKTDENAKKALLEFYINKLTNIGNIDKVNETLQKRPKKLKIVVDCGNAMGGFVMPIVADLYNGNIEFVKLFWNLDSDFPNHQADPLNFDTLTSLQAKILESGADLGLAIDGDGDRVGFVDKAGVIIKSDETVAILSKGFLEGYYGNPEAIETKGNPVILFDQRSRSIVPQTILEFGGVPVATKVGHTNFKQNMQIYSAQYGGEVSGHHYFREFGCMDSAAMAIVSFIDIFSRHFTEVSQIHTKILDTTFTTQGEVNFKLPTHLDFEKVKTLTLKAFPEARYNLLDGLTIFLDDWKASIRMSNTEPLLRLNLETFGSNKVEQKVELIKSILGL